MQNTKKNCFVYIVAPFPLISSNGLSQQVSSSAEMDPVLVTSCCGVSITRHVLQTPAHGLFIEFLYFQGLQLTLTINDEVLLNETISGKS